eukprot:COSAG02_NODE_549_length_20461_cov_11.385866_18_plen_31_part_00
MGGEDVCGEQYAGEGVVGGRLITAGGLKRA